MKNHSRILMLLASGLLIITFLVPLWSIDLNAPQYPEGLGLYIYLNKLEGHKEGDLQSIKRIESLYWYESYKSCFYSRIENHSLCHTFYDIIRIYYCIY